MVSYKDEKIFAQWEMNATVAPAKKNHKFQGKKFCKGFFPWLLCIPINIVPILIVYIDKVEANRYSNIWLMLSDIVKDIDFMFIFVAVLFVLPLQGLFSDYSDSILQGAGTACSVACYFCSVFLLIVYLLCTLHTAANNLLYAPYSFIFNIVILVLTIIAGATIHVLLSLEKA